MENTQTSSVLVIGAGVLGLAAARELAVRGNQVTLVDAAGPDQPLAGASHRSFAWINANNKPPAAYHRLNARGIAEHHRLQQELDGTWFHESGCVLVASADVADARVDWLRSQDYPVSPVPRTDLAGVEPAVDWSTLPGSALHLPSEGHLDADLFAAGLAADLADRGVEVTKGLVTKVSTGTSGSAGARVLLDNGTELTADTVVIAAGAASRDLGLPVAAVDVPTPRVHSLIGLTAATEVPLGHVVISERINLRPRHDGRLWVQLPGVEHRVVEAAEPGEPVDPSLQDALLDDVRRIMESELREVLGSDIAVEQVFLSARSLPEDGFPLVGFTDSSRRIYSLVTHSGMTLAALLGRLAAVEITAERAGTGGQDGELADASDLLASFRPDREQAATPAPSTPFVGRQ